MDALPHERLDVYRVALMHFREVHLLTADLRGRTGWLIRDQLLRAALSVLLNIAEGNGETHQAERARFFTIARRSADECSACLDALVAVELRSLSAVRDAKALLKREIEMLIRMIQKTGASPIPKRT